MCYYKVSFFSFRQRVPACISLYLCYLFISLYQFVSCFIILSVYQLVSAFIMFYHCICFFFISACQLISAYIYCICVLSLYQLVSACIMFYRCICFICLSACIMFYYCISCSERLLLQKYYYSLTPTYARAYTHTHALTTAKTRGCLSHYP